METRGGARVTSPVQTYLDLRQLKGRSEEAADFLKQKVINPHGRRSIDYTAAPWKLARSVLIELTHILGEYRDDMVLVGLLDSRAADLAKPGTPRR